MKDYFGYKNKICVVTGAASGIGKKTAELLIELDAEVYALDITKIELEGAKKFIEVDLSSKESIDLAMKQLPEHIDSFFGVAGLSGAKTNYYKTFTVNYIANKYITEEYLKNRMSAGGTIAYVTSTGGLYWDKYAHEFEKFTNAKTWDEMIEALHKQAKETTLGMMAYPLSKRALNYYMAKLAIELGPEKIRVNALLPGSTDTGMKKEFEVEAGGIDALVAETGTAKRLATPEEMAEPLIFLNSDMATFITGLPLIVDAGTNAMIKLKQKKDRMNMKVGSKIFNLEFIQKQLAKQLEPLQQEESNKPIEQAKNNTEEQSSTEKENNSEDTEIL
ncbi:MAG: SDR family oxidoreductase [Bacilli bacterium]|nr:SDR family oxidoreductase [Bacilli bacterium]